MANCDAVYAERDQLVAALSRLFPSVIGPVDDAEPGWTSAVYVDTPAGQLSWHVPDHELATYFAGLSRVDVSPWDGHTTEEKYRRLAMIGNRNG